MSTREEIAMWTNLTEARVRVSLQSPYIPTPGTLFNSYRNNDYNLLFV